MWLPEDTRYTAVVTDQCELFFLQLWHGMVHRSATDSFRMRCMNPLNILEELYDLIQKQKNGLPDEVDIKLVAKEAHSILSADSVMKNHFGQQAGLLMPLLERVGLGDTQGDKKKQLFPIYSLLSYYLRDVIAILKVAYRSKLIDTLREALFSEKSVDHVFEYTGALLSLLIHEGHSIESLFSMLQSVFLYKDDRRTFSFQRNFDFSRRFLETAEKSYEVILRMEGFTHDPPQDIAGFEFSREFTVTGVDARAKALLSPGLNVIFAKTKVEGRDDRSAGMQARKRLDDILDLIRFELEVDVITVRPDFVSIGMDSDKVRVYPLPSQIPNPKKNVDSGEFMNFVGKIGDVIDNPLLDSQSKEKIRSAFHFYRIGRDAEQFENKFLNWWTALEYLVRSGEGNIMAEIEKRLVPILILGYSRKHIRSYAKALYFCRVRPSAQAVARFRVADYKDLNSFDFLAILKDDNEFREIETGLSRYPSLLFYLQRFREQIHNATTIKAFYDQHEERIRWHINRIYRIRCDIVHSADYSMNLTLLGANLEYYLKYVLTAILEDLTNNKAISSLTELYDRIGYTFECLKNDLVAKRTDFHDRLLRTGEHQTLPCT
jgi:hypothetical protein